jgi:DNA mismatch repair protein MutH
MGHLIEEHHFEYKINSDQEPDFPKAGVELKVTPYEIGKKGGYSAGERLVITMISYQHAVEEDFYASHVYKKLKLTLLVHYLRNRSLTRMEYPINFITLFSPPEEDLKIIQQDYEKIITKVKEGKAHELSEGDTMYLGANTKGSNSIKSNVPQEFYAPEQKAKKRAFCFKQSYMTYILNKYVREKVATYESILSSVHDIEDKTFEELIVDKINTHRGKTDAQLMIEFEVKPGAKNFWSSLAYRMLGIKSNRAEEFVKANIEVKTIRLDENGKMKESISFPHMTLIEFAQEEWEESDFYNDLSTKRYLFVVFKRRGGSYVLKGCQLWNISNEDLDEARIGWGTIKQVLQQGVDLWKKYQKNGIDFKVHNNFPKMEANRIIHIRPHTSKRYYVLEDGEIIGNYPSYGDELPDGRVMTKQCFWLNYPYILSQLDEKLKN